MKIAITGYSGFLGKAVSRLLAPYNPYLIRTLDVFDQIQGSIDVIIHLAGKTDGLYASQGHPASILHTNVSLLDQIYQIAVKKNVRRMILASSVCAYPDKQQVLVEEGLWNGLPNVGNEAYGIAKRLMDVYARSYHKEFGITSCVLLFANLYGPGDKSSHVIPDLIRSARRNSLRLADSGAASRDFLHVEDAAAAVECCVKKFNAGRYNVGSGHSVVISKVAQFIAGYIGCDLGGPHKFLIHGTAKRVIDSTSFRETFGWAPKKDFWVELGELCKEQ